MSDWLPGGRGHSILQGRKAGGGGRVAAPATAGLSHARAHCLEHGFDAVDALLQVRSLAQGADGIRSKPMGSAYARLPKLQPHCCEQQLICLRLAALEVLSCGTRQ